jgi:hypothetical protein
LRRQECLEAVWKKLVDADAVAELVVKIHFDALMLSFTPASFQSEAMMAHRSARFAIDVEPPLRASKRARFVLSEDVTQRQRQQAPLEPKVAPISWMPRIAEEGAVDMTRKRAMPSDVPVDYVKRPRTPATTAYLEDGSEYAIVPHETGAHLMSRNLFDPTPSNDLAIVPYVAPYPLYSGPLQVSRCTIEQLDSDDEDNDAGEEKMDVES